MADRRTVLTERAGWLHRWDGHGLEPARCNSCGDMVSSSSGPLILSFIGELPVLEHSVCPTPVQKLKLVRPRP